MKRLLFIINNLNCGGAEKALVSLLQALDFNKYEVDLFLFKHEGIFMKNIPKEVRLLKEPTNYKYFDMPLSNAIPELLKKRKFNVLINRIKFKFLVGIGTKSSYEQRVWKYLSSSIGNLDKYYDVAIGYLEKTPIYFCVDKVKAHKKIGWIHNDYEKLGMDKSFDLNYFTQLNYVFTVSKECQNVLMKVFPEIKDKFKLMHNIISNDNINKLSLENNNDFAFDTSYINIVSMGRLSYQKGFELAINACRVLVNNKLPIRWLIIGEGEERVKLQRIIDENQLEKNIILIGTKENPYPYLKKCDIYVQPSRYEGKSIAIDEAKILNKPIVVTDFSTARDQIINNINGLIVKMDEEAIANGIKTLITDEELRKKFINNLKDEAIDNKSEINKLYEVI